jgi:quercetin dioxygenase-like cupin family protein
MYRSPLQVLIVVILLAIPLRGAAQAPEMRAIANNELQWADLDVPGFAAGMKLAAMIGDPAVADEPYTLRLKFPPEYRFPAHFHPKAENLTVISGTFLLGMGAQASEKLTSYSAGDYILIPAEMPHYGGARGETVIQLHGIGPFEIILAKPSTQPTPSH